MKRRGHRWKFVGGGIVGRYADTSSRNHFRLSEKPWVIKMTPPDKSDPIEEEKIKRFELCSTSCKNAA